MVRGLNLTTEHWVTNKNHVYNQPRQCQLLKDAIDKMAADVIKKYPDIHCMDIVAINKKHDHVLHIAGDDDWHNYIWAYKLLEDCPALEITMSLKMGESRFFVYPEDLYVITYKNGQQINMHAAMTGEEKIMFAIMIHNDKGNRLQFTFYVDKKNITVAYEIALFEKYKGLIADLNKEKNFLDAFLFYWEEHGILVDCNSLKATLGLPHGEIIKQGKLNLYYKDN